MLKSKRCNRRAFTIMEILIAITILMVGIVGVISLFPVAIKIGGEAISDSLSANLSRSVEETLRAAIKHRKVAYTSKADRVFVLSYLIYEHDGIYDPKVKVVEKDPVPADPLLIRSRGTQYWGLDCVVLLPCDNSSRADPSRGYSGENLSDARRRAYLAGKVFVYPENDPEESKGGGASPNGAGDPRRADDDKDDYEQDHSDDDVVSAMRQRLVAKEEWPLRITKTFRFGPKVIGGDSGDDVIGASTGNKSVSNPYRMYSYAFAIRRAYEDGNVNNSARGFSPANDLFEVKIMVFRGFMKETKQARPIYTSTFLVSR